MKIYSVELRPDRRSEPDVVLLKEGFSWPAFLFGPLWFLWHRLWLGLGLYLLLQMALAAIVYAAVLNEPQQLILGLGAALLVGWHANDIRRWTLRRHGYHAIDVVGARDLDEAERRMLEKLAALQHHAARAS